MTRGFKGVNRPHDVRREILRWLLYGWNDVAYACEVKDVLGILKERIGRSSGPQILNLENKVRIVAVLLKVFNSSAYQIVNGVHAVDATDVQVNHVAAYETVSASEDGNSARAHPIPPFFKYFTLM